MNNIVVSSGDIGGINLFILIKSAYKFPNTEFILFLNKQIFKQYADYFYLNIPDNITIKNIDINPQSFIIGKYNTYLSRIAFISLKESIEFIKKNNYKKFLTMPVNKYGISKLYPGFTGHTEFLGREFNCKTIMLLYSPGISVVPLTTHISLSKVEHNLSFELLKRTLENVRSFYIKRFNIKPKIKILCVNPHCSDNNLLSDIDNRIKQWVKKLDNEFNISQPISSDTAFTESMIKETDIYICTYHDQALIPFKMKAFYDGINITLGLPFIRVSPDHGPAYDKVNNINNINTISVENAIKFLIECSD